MDNILAQSDSAGMWAHRDAEPKCGNKYSNACASSQSSLGSHEEHAEYLTDAGKTARVNLHYINCLGLEQLFEHHPVVRVLACGDTDTVRLQSFPDSRVPEDIIRRSRLLNEPENC